MKEFAGNAFLDGSTSVALDDTRQASLGGALCGQSMNSFLLLWRPARGFCGAGRRVPFDHELLAVPAIFVARGILGIVDIVGAAHFGVAVEMACILCVNSPMIRGMVLESEIAGKIKKSAIIVMELGIEPAPPEHTVLGQMGFCPGNI